MAEYEIADSETGEVYIVEADRRPSPEEERAIINEMRGQESAPRTVELGPQSMQLPESTPAQAAPAPQATQGPIGDAVAELSQPEQAAIGAGDAILSAATGAAGQSAGGLAGLAVLPFAGPEAAAETVENVSSAMTWRPRTQHGQEIMQSVSDFMTAPNPGGKYITNPIEKARIAAGDVGYNIAGPAGGAVAQTLPELIEFLMGGFFTKMVRGKPVLDPAAEDVIKEAADAPTPEQAAVVLERKVFDEPRQKGNVVSQNIEESYPISKPEEVDAPRPPLRAEREPVPGGPVIPEDIKADLATGVPSNVTAGYRIDNPDLPYESQRVVKDKPARKAMGQQFRPGTVASIQAANKPTRGAMARALDELEKGMANDTYAARHRPADVAGDVLVEEINGIARVMKKAMKEVRKTSRDLKGTKVETSGILNNFLDKVEQLGGTYDPVKRELIIDEAGPLEGMKDVQNKLKLAFNKLQRLGDNPDAFAVHQVKEWIDNITDYGKSSDKSSVRRAENTIKSMRHNINQELRGISGEYAAANDKFSTAKEALDGIQSAVGKKVKLDGKNANAQLGTLLRRLLSNAQSRIPIRDAVDEIGRVADINGFKSDVDMDALLSFINTLEENFGSSAPTSFMHEIGKAVKPLIRGGVDPVGGAVDIAASGWRFANKQDERRALEALREMVQ